MLGVYLWHVKEPYQSITLVPSSEPHLSVHLYTITYMAEILWTVVLSKQTSKTICCGTSEAKRNIGIPLSVHRSVTLCFCWHHVHSVEQWLSWELLCLASVCPSSYQV